VRVTRLRQGRVRQGNRVKELCGDEACEEVVVPGGGFALEAEGVLAGGLYEAPRVKSFFVVFPDRTTAFAQGWCLRLSNARRLSAFMA
jgi:hypothetical protein